VARERDRLVCAFDKTRLRINREVRDLHGRGEEVEPGDRMIRLSNHRAPGLFNGVQGAVLKARPGKQRRFDIDTGGAVLRNVPFDPRQSGREKPVTGFTPGGSLRARSGAAAGPGQGRGRNRS
jgi:hypothetical protein